MECGGNDAALASGDAYEAGTVARPRMIPSAARGAGDDTSARLPARGVAESPRGR